MTIPPTDCTTAINPSNTLSVTAFATKMVSADKRLINSPVLVLSKNAVSCSSMELKSVLRSLTITFCPEITVSQIIIILYKQKLHLNGKQLKTSQETWDGH